MRDAGRGRQADRVTHLPDARWIAAALDRLLDHLQDPSLTQGEAVDVGRAVREELKAAVSPSWAATSLARGRPRRLLGCGNCEVGDVSLGSLCAIRVTIENSADRFKHLFEACWRIRWPAEAWSRNCQTPLIECFTTRFEYFVEYLCE